MLKLTLAFAATALGVTVIAEPALAQANEQFLPSLVYRTGPYAPNGIPFADGVSDYWTLLNERDGGINGSRSRRRNARPANATDKGVECYERLKSKGPTGSGYFSPLSTGITFALTEKVPGDKISLLTMGYGRSESKNGAVFPWNFIAVGSYWTAADVAIQHMLTSSAASTSSRGKKISLVYHDSPYGKEPIAALEERAKLNGCTFKAIPGHTSGRRAESRSGWRSVRTVRTTCCSGLGRDELHRHQGSGGVGYPARQDDRRVVVGRRARRNASRRSVQRLQGADASARAPAKFKVQTICRSSCCPRANRLPRTTTRRCSTIAACLNSMIGTEAIRTAMKKYGNKPLTGEQIRWGFENLNLTAARIKELGFEGMLEPMKFSCQDHQGSDIARMQQ